MNMSFIWVCQNIRGFPSPTGLSLSDLSFNNPPDIIWKAPLSIIHDLPEIKSDNDQVGFSIHLHIGWTLVGKCHSNYKDGSIRDYNPPPPPPAASPHFGEVVFFVCLL